LLRKRFGFGLLVLCAGVRDAGFAAQAFVLCVCLCAGIRVLPSWRGRFGLLVFALASALCLRASSVAPVRGGTYFSLPPQRKVGKRKRLTPPTFLLA
jgi:hypothetical protein